MANLVQVNNTISKGKSSDYFDIIKFGYTFS